MWGTSAAGGDRTTAVGGPVWELEHEGNGNKITHGTTLRGMIQLIYFTMTSRPMYKLQIFGRR